MSQSTGDKLIIAAIRVFSEKGFFNTKISDIVQEAGVAQGTFYLYFKSKEEIFYRIVQLIVSRIESVIEKYSQMDEHPVRTIKLFGREIFQILYEYKEIAYIFFFQVICVGKEFQDVYFETSQKIKRFYEDKLSDYGDSSLRAEMLIGFGKRLVEFGILHENRSFSQIVKQFETAVDIITGE
ncbi:TetR/AcrR family transcriptional regulator [Persephonella sp.]